MTVTMIGTRHSAYCRLSNCAVLTPIVQSTSLTGSRVDGLEHLQGANMSVEFDEWNC